MDFWLCLSAPLGSTATSGPQRVQNRQPGVRRVAFPLFGKTEAVAVSHVQPPFPGPLRRAEWIKFVVLLFNEEAKAVRGFEGILKRYLCHRQAVAVHQRKSAIALRLRETQWDGVVVLTPWELAVGRGVVPAANSLTTRWLAPTTSVHGRSAASVYGASFAFVTANKRSAVSDTWTFVWYPSRMAPHKSSGSGSLQRLFKMQGLRQSTPAMSICGNPRYRHSFG